MFLYRNIVAFPEPGLLIRDPSEFVLQSTNAALNPLEALGHEALARPDFYALMEQYRENMFDAIKPHKAWVDMTRALPKAFSGNNHLPMDPYSAGVEVAYDIYRDYPKPEWEIKVNDQLVEPEIITSRTFGTLKRFSCGDESALTILAFAPMSGHHATLIDNKVQTMCQQGFNVVVTDWEDPKTIPLEAGEFNLDTYIEYAIDFIGELLEMYGPNLHLDGVCQPGPAIIAALSVRAARGLPNPASLTLSGSPIDTRLNPTAVNDSLEGVPSGYFRDYLFHTVPEKYLGAGRKTIPGLLQNIAFKGPNLKRHVNDFRDYYLALIAGDSEAIKKHQKFRHQYESMTDLEEGYMRQTKQTVFLEHHLPKGVMKYTDPKTGEVITVDPNLITQMALATVEGTRDDITGAGQCHAAQDLLTATPTDKRLRLEIDRGHYGIFSGSAFQAKIAPQLAQFMRENSAEKLDT